MPKTDEKGGASEFESSRIQAELGRASLPDPGATSSQVPQPHEQAPAATIAGHEMIFRDRTEAGQFLATEIARLELADPVVLALPRGGVPVGAAVAEALSAPLDVLIVRKVGAPGNPELAVAAIVDGDPPDVVLNRSIVEAFGLDEDEVAQLIKRERPELDRRREAYRGSRRPLSVRGKSVIVVDDGAATGVTMKVALRAVRHRGPREIIVALPVAPRDTIDELRPEADRIVCLSQPLNFRALSLHYRSFLQLADDEVQETLLAVARARAKRLRERKS